MSLLDTPLQGGCRCSQLRYNITRAPLMIYACHCTDCQQLSASAYSLGMAVPDNGVTLLEGQETAWTKTAESGHHSTKFFCPVCGAWVFTRTDSHPDMAIVRPSTLDDRSWIKPIAQIFTRSAQPWALLDVPFSFAGAFGDPAPLISAFQRAFGDQNSALDPLGP